MAAEARAAAGPLFQTSALPAPTTPAEQYLQMILGELCAIRELLIAPDSETAVSPAAVQLLREQQPKPRRR